MHYHCEIILPPVSEAVVETTIAEIMEPFSENNAASNNPFWDWYEIGGRFSGSKRVTRIDEKELKDFFAWMRAEGITVSGLTWGKQELEPASHIGTVDAEWNRRFPAPDGSLVACPLFRHSGSRLPGDIQTLRESQDAECHHVIFCGRGYGRLSGVFDGRICAKSQYLETIWNGLTYQKTVWDGKIPSALELYMESLDGRSDDYRKAQTPEDDWLCVTVDYHS